MVPSESKSPSIQIAFDWPFRLLSLFKKAIYKSHIMLEWVIFCIAHTPKPCKTMYFIASGGLGKMLPWPTDFDKHLSALEQLSTKSGAFG